MSFVQALTDFFDILFKSNSPEVQKRIKLRKVEAELKNHPAGIYKNNLLQPNFAEALRILYTNVEPIAKILDNTIASPDVKRNHRFEQELVITGYSAESKQMLDSLSYENRMKDLVDNTESSEHKIFELQRHKLEKVLGDLNGAQFAKMDDVIAHLKQLADLCHFNYVTPLQIFDDGFAAHHHEEGYVPMFMPLPVSAFENVFLDLYYLTADFSIDMAVGNAILALNQLLLDKENDARTKKELMQNLRKISAVLKNPLDAKTLTNLVRLSKGDPNFVPQKASYAENVCKNFGEKLQSQFQADEQKIRNAIKDSYVQQELSELFPDGKLEPLKGYCAETMELIGNNSTSNFMWVVPMQIVKKFFKVYYSEGLKGLLNDIVVEGLFTNPANKSNFSQMVYSINDSVNLIDAFEKHFETEGKYSIATITSYIDASRRDPDFGKKLSMLVDEANVEAKDIIQKTATLLFALSEDLGDFLQDAKRSSSELVTNLKSIMFSSRNRETTSMLELQFPLWKNFFEIIKNYVIIKKTKRDQA